MLNHKEAKFPCNYCKKTFHRKDVQSKHMKVCQLRQNPDIMEDIIIFIDSPSDIKISQDKDSEHNYCLQEEHNYCLQESV